MQRYFPLKTISEALNELVRLNSDPKLQLHVTDEGVRTRPSPPLDVHVLRSADVASVSFLCCHCHAVIISRPDVILLKLAGNSNCG